SGLPLIGCICRQSRCTCFPVTSPTPAAIYTLSLHDALPICPYSERLFTLDSAIDLGPEGIVVASYAQEDNPPVEHAPMGLQGGLYVHTCDDTDCTEPLTVDLTEKIFHPEAEAPSVHHVDVPAS